LAVIRRGFAGISSAVVLPARNTAEMVEYHEAESEQTS